MAVVMAVVMAVESAESVWPVSMGVVPRLVSVATARVSPLGSVVVVELSATFPVSVLGAVVQAVATTAQQMPMLPRVSVRILGLWLIVALLLLSGSPAHSMPFV
ncbi:MAG: hypothetical protein AAGF11_25890 [Myxococcota bacterium]